MQQTPPGFLLALTIVLSASPVVVRAQSFEDGLLRLTVRAIPYVHSNSPLRFEIFGPLETLTVDVTLEHEDSLRPLLLDRGFFQGIRWTLDRAQTAGSGDAPSRRLRLERIQAVTCGPASNATCDPVARTVLHAENWVTARMHLRPESGEIEIGNYDLMVDTSAARRRLLGTDERPWTGRVLEPGSVPLTVRAAMTSDDQTARYEAEALDAMKRADYRQALSAFRRILAINPANRKAQVRVGGALLELGEFHEAALVLESAWRVRHDSFAGDELVIAYIAMNRDVEAQAILTALYGPVQGAKVMEQSRRVASNLASRRR